MAKFSKLGGLAIILAALLFTACSLCSLYWHLEGPDGYSTTLRIKAEQLHRGMKFQEMTNIFHEFEVLQATNYLSPEREINYRFYMERDHVQQWFSKNFTASKITYLGPRRGWSWRDYCSIYFDTKGTIVGYEWQLPH